MIISNSEIKKWRELFSFGLMVIIKKLVLTKNIFNWFFFKFLSKYNNLELRNLEISRVIREITTN